MSDRESDVPADVPRLAVWPCQSSCAWLPTVTTWSTDAGEKLPLFACTGCGSQWVRTEAWTPVDAHGFVPLAVAEERRKQV